LAITFFLDNWTCRCVEFEDKEFIEHTGRPERRWNEDVKVMIGEIGCEKERMDVSH
jgi:hypothetical protein